MHGRRQLLDVQLQIYFWDNIQRSDVPVSYNNCIIYFSDNYLHNVPFSCNDNIEFQKDPFCPWQLFVQILWKSKIAEDLVCCSSQSNSFRQSSRDGEGYYLIIRCELARMHFSTSLEIGDVNSWTFWIRPTDSFGMGV